jgi:hypothetical protein
MMAVNIEARPSILKVEAFGTFKDIGYTYAIKPELVYSLL